MDTITSLSRNVNANVTKFVLTGGSKVSLVFQKLNIFFLLIICYFFLKRGWAAVSILNRKYSLK